MYQGQDGGSSLPQCNYIRYIQNKSHEFLEKSNVLRTKWARGSLWRTEGPHNTPTPLPPPPTTFQAFSKFEHVQYMLLRRLATGLDYRWILNCASAFTRGTGHSNEPVNSLRTNITRVRL